MGELTVTASAPLPKLPGRTKAAILLLSLGPEQAAEVFRHLNREEAERLAVEMARTGRVEPGTANAVIEEALDLARAREYIVEGGVDFAREILERSLGAERAAGIMRRLSGMVERRPFEFLRTVPPMQIQAFLSQESPQTAALVIANLPPTTAAQVLAEFDPEEQADISTRVATMSETNPDILVAVEDVVREKLSSALDHEFAAVGGVKSLAEILGNSDRGTERNVLDRLERVDGKLAEEVRALLFTFEDITLIDDRGIQLVLKDVDQRDLVLALRGVGDDVLSRIFTNMSERGAEMLREEMQYTPPQRRKAVEEAQGRIVAIMRRLEEEGEILVARG
ncbi:MAG TPA: flagellar motor switch protein FliG, partial [Solirubrobacteraceae bacterium]|nr:flagellar motor switch protein FliG [Solirubrobacteraceae bacterium]